MYSLIHETAPDFYETVDELTLDQLMKHYEAYTPDPRIRLFIESMKPGQYVMFWNTIVIKSGQYLDLWSTF